MSGLIPEETIRVLRLFNDLSVDLYGITCTLYVPTNTTTVESMDAYTQDHYTFQVYPQVPVWIEWAAKDLKRLRKMGIFMEYEGEMAIIAWFKNTPEIILNSYIKLETKYIPDTYTDIDEFEIVEVIMKSTYDNEIYRCFRIAPRRVKS